jgi:Tfp pilus assembly protein PilN
VLRTNLSTRPFYNERGVHIAIGIAAVLIAALTIWNVVEIVSLSRQNTELATRVNGDHAEAQQLTKMAADIRGRIDQQELQRVVDSAREANALIDQRTFSWTAFFNRLEATMPPDVMLTSVRPAVNDGTTRVTMTVVGRRAVDVDEFIEKLEATGAFEDVVPSQQDRTDEGLYRVVLESVYTGLEAPPAAASPENAVATASQPGAAR